MPLGAIAPVRRRRCWECVPLRSNLVGGCLHKPLQQDCSHYREGAAVLELGEGFFRPDSRPSRDLSVLIAAGLRQGGAQRPQRWLDLMAGCGIRALRWGLEACADEAPLLPELWINDADGERGPLLQRNLAPLTAFGERVQLRRLPAEVLLRQAYLDQRYFDLIDLDAFGCPNALLQASVQALAFEGVLLLASTDGRSPTGHDRPAAVRRFGAAARVHPASWEIALRLQFAALAREAWLLGRGLQPLLAFSEGRTFRLAIRLRQHMQPKEEHQLGLLARCDACGAQAIQPLLRLQGWPLCACSNAGGRWAVSGPLWLGPLQNQSFLQDLRRLGEEMPASVAPATRRLLERLSADPGLPPTVWPTAELAQRLRLPGPPSQLDLVTALRAQGFNAFGSAVMAGQVRTDAPYERLLQCCRDLDLEDR
jgi:tRNA (guanine26-N2/guanine27-N2)-dimethyltransferase